MASKPTEMCVIETTGAREYKVRMNSSLFVTIMTSVSLSLDLFLTQKREMDNYIPSGKSGRRFSRSSFSRRHLLDDDALFNPARFEKTRNASSSRKKMKTCLSLSLSVCLSLSRARRGKEEQTTRNKKASPQSRRLTAAQKKAISSNSRFVV